VTVNLSIKGVPAHIAAQLRARAERNHRSLQGELMAIVTAATNEDAQPPGAAAAQGAPARSGWKTLEQIAAEGRERHPKPVSRFGRSVDLIRQMRDSR
jgi:plasmid stability protein